MKRNEYKVWKANMWDEDLLQEIVAIFFWLGESYGVCRVLSYFRTDVCCCA